MTDDEDDVIDIPWEGESGDEGVIVTAFVNCSECGQGVLTLVTPDGVAEVTCATHH